MYFEAVHELVFIHLYTFKCEFTNFENNENITSIWKKKKRNHMLYFANLCIFYCIFDWMPDSRGA